MLDKNIFIQKYGVEYDEFQCCMFFKHSKSRTDPKKTTKSERMSLSPLSPS